MGETRKIATTVPMTQRADGRQHGQQDGDLERPDDVVLRRAARPSRLPSGRRGTGYAARAAVSGRHTVAGSAQVQAAGVGGLPAPGLKPAGPRLASTAFCQEPSEMNFLSASVTLVQNSVSPFFRPTPYFSVGEGLADDAQLALVGLLGGVAGEDGVVGGQGVDAAGLERVHALGVRVVLLQVAPRGPCAFTFCGRRRPCHRAQLLAGQRVRAGDRRCRRLRTSRSCPAMKYGPAKETFSLRASVIE